MHTSLFILSMFLIGISRLWAGLPQDWYSLSEALQLESVETAPTSDATTNIDSILNAHQTALDQMPEFKVAELNNDPKNQPTNQTGWHPEFFMIDLGVTASGFSGLLAYKGTAAVSIYWRRQWEAALKERKSEFQTAEAVPTAVPAIVIDDSLSRKKLQLRLEPMIRTILASGKIQNESTLRENLMTSALEFQEMTKGLSNDPGFSWWVSKFRLDLGVEASGKVNPLVVSTGGSIALRFEWHRMKRATKPSKLTPESMSSNMNQFVRALVEDLEVLSNDGLPSFQAYTFKVGVGMSVKRKILIAKGAASATAQIYFSRDVKKPNVNPAPKSQEKLYLVESNTYKNGIYIEEDNDNVIYEISRQRFREGLEKAKRIGKFFADRANTLNSQAKSEQKWKIYQLKTSFDMSVSGVLGLSTVAGLATAEISFYNHNF